VNIEETESENESDEFQIESLYLSHTITNINDSQDDINNIKTTDLFNKFKDQGLKDSLQTVWVWEENWNLEILQQEINNVGYNVEVLDW